MIDLAYGCSGARAYVRPGRFLFNHRHMARMDAFARRIISAATLGGLVPSAIMASMVAVMASNTRLVLARQALSDAAPGNRCEQAPAAKIAAKQNQTSSMMSSWRMSLTLRPCHCSILATAFISR